MRTGRRYEAAAYLASMPSPAAPDVIAEAVARIVRAADPLRIAVFGSVARGAATPDSDLDLLVVVPRVENRRQATVSLRRALDDLPQSPKTSSSRPPTTWRAAGGSSGPSSTRRSGTGGPSTSGPSSTPRLRSADSHRRLQEQEGVRPTPSPVVSFRAWSSEHSTPTDPAMAKKSHHVVPSPGGGWSVKAGGATRASKHFSTQKEATAWGRAVSRKQGSEFVVHGRDGTIRSKDSYGGDPNPPRDKK